MPLMTLCADGRTNTLSSIAPLRLCPSTATHSTTLKGSNSSPRPVIAAPLSAPAPVFCGPAQIDLPAARLVDSSDLTPLLVPVGSVALDAPSPDPGDGPVGVCGR